MKKYKLSTSSQGTLKCIKDSVVKIINSEKSPSNRGVTLKKLESNQTTRGLTTVYHETNFQYNAPHRFMVLNTESKEIVGDIHFQEGPVKEAGINGVFNEDLIAMVICRLEHFNESPYRCDENAAAIQKLEEALDILRQRTNKRKERGVLGTNEV